MITALLVATLSLGTWQATPTDTVVIDAGDAFRRALATAPALEAARRRTQAADASLRQTGAWANPVLSVSAENVGATRPISGVSGVEGLEGQALISGLLPLGGDRGAARMGAEALRSEARSLEVGTEADVHVAVVQALALAVRDEQRLARALEEAAGLESLADALAAQAERGRASEGEAARAHLAMVSAHTTAAEVAAEAAVTREQLALLIGVAPGTYVSVELPTCRSPSPIPVASTDNQAPEVLAASARLQLATAGVAQRRAARVPDLIPQVGVRRAAGVSALYLGFSVPLPLFDRGGAGVEAALAEEAAYVAELDRVERSVAAQRESLRQGLEALEAAGARYTPDWALALDQAVLSAEARYRLGEGTLTELLDGRRARLTALDGYEQWRAKLFTQRALLARNTGEPIDAAMLCGASLHLKTHSPENRP
jgi:cobalt-zinc-cadmium efflux system outer membrane protein